MEYIHGLKWKAKKPGEAPEGGVEKYQFPVLCNGRIENSSGVWGRKGSKKGREDKPALPKPGKKKRSAQSPKKLCEKLEWKRVWSFQQRIFILSSLSQRQVTKEDRQRERGKETETGKESYAKRTREADKQ